jgi:hypothetical protein
VLSKSAQTLGEIEQPVMIQQISRFFDTPLMDIYPNKVKSESRFRFQKYKHDQCQISLK